jgi:hypothetical protein
MAREVCGITGCFQDHTFTSRFHDNTFGRRWTFIPGLSGFAAASTARGLRRLRGACGLSRGVPHRGERRIKVLPQQFCPSLGATESALQIDTPPVSILASFR